MNHTEAWIKTDDDGYTITAIMEVEDMVQVSSQIAEQLGLTMWQPRYYSWFPYAEVSAALLKDGRTLKVDA